MQLKAAVFTAGFKPKALEVIKVSDSKEFYLTEQQFAPALGLEAAAGSVISEK